jgi:hypothetical protein
MEKILELLSYTLVFMFVHEMNARSYLKENNLDNTEYNKNVHRNIVDIINIITSISISIIYFVTGYTIKDNRLYGTNEIGMKAILIHVALFIYEIFYNIIDEKNVNMFIHHIALIGFFSYSVYKEFLQFYISAAGFAEITNMFLIPLTLFKRTNLFLDKLVYPGIGLFFSFLFARLMLLPYVYYLSYSDFDDVKEEDIYHFYAGRVALLLIIILSIYWFIKITRLLVREANKSFK